ncbi:MAG: T9SS type A sorting domain-containing protein, partial [Flavobacteriales bacterium]|nr:T9SS type A sorting domain-containing protein [Flavobacteriales bacterium]
QGAVFLVLPSWLCHIFGNAKDASSDEEAIVADLMNRFDSYEDFERSLINEMAQVNIFPNPATDILNLDVQNVISDEVLNIRLMDGMGRVALESTISPNKENITLDISNLAPGSYVMTIQSEFRNRTNSVIITR